MKTPVIIVAIIVGLIAAYVGYSYMNHERTAGERLDGTMHEISQGNLGEAVDEASSRTNGDKIQEDLNDAKDAVTPASAQ